LGSDFASVLRPDHLHLHWMIVRYEPSAGTIASLPWCNRELGRTPELGQAKHSLIETYDFRIPVMVTL
jgi:hypothetical protein